MSIIITILFLTLLNAFFAMSEMAIVAASKPVLRDMLKKGNKGVQNVLKIMEDQGRFLSSIQVGITAVGTLAAAYGGANIAHHFGDFLDQLWLIDPYGQSIALVIVVTCLTYISVVLGELIPKRIALRNPETISVLVARPMLAFASFFSPIVRLFDVSAEIIMKFFGIFGGAQNSVTEAQLQAIISEGAETGVIEKSEHEMMQRIFRLDDRDAKSIMTHITEAVSFSINDSNEEIKSKLQEVQHSRYLVFDASMQKVLGIVQSKYILSDYVKTGNFEIKKHLKEVQFVSENTNCLKVLEMFKTSSIHLVVVVDEYGAPEGIITASDIFEAVVGLLPSNYDEEGEVMIKEREDGSWLVDGITPIDEIAIVIGIEEINLTEKYDTIAGFVLDNIEETASEGVKFHAQGFTFEIVDMDESKVDKILISKDEKEVEEDLSN